MSLDFFILMNTAFSVLFGMVIHLVVFRNIQPEKAIRFLPVVVFSGGIMPVLISGLAVNQTQIIFAQKQMINVIDLTIISMIFYFLSMFIYILGVFGLMAAAVRIRLICDIAKKGNEGITYGQLQKGYNQEIIVRKRLERLVSSGILDYQQGQFRLKNRRSIFFLYVSLILLLRKIYTGK